MGKGAQIDRDMQLLSAPLLAFPAELRCLLEAGRGDKAQQLLADSQFEASELAELLIDLGENADQPHLASRCRHLLAWLASAQQHPAWDRVAQEALQADLASPSTPPEFRSLATQKLDSFN